MSNDNIYNKYGINVEEFSNLLDREVMLAIMDDPYIKRNDMPITVITALLRDSKGHTFALTANDKAIPIDNIKSIQPSTSIINMIKLLKREE